MGISNKLFIALRWAWVAACLAGKRGWQAWFKMPRLAVDAGADWKSAQRDLEGK